MRVAIVHDWLTGMGDAEKCLEAFCEIFPGADIFTLFHLPGAVSPAIERCPIHTSPLQRFPGGGRRLRRMLPLMPSAVRMFPLGEYDVILSNSRCVAKGARGGYGTYHLSYCHAPMRYAWNAYEESLARLGGPARWFFPHLAEYLRKWDNEANRGVHDFLTGSHAVAARIRQYYGREAEVLYPPVDTVFYQSPNGARREDYYLMVTDFAPGAGACAAVEAFGRLGRPLRVAGAGQERDFERVRALDKPNVEFLGGQDAESLRALYGGCRALICPGEEGFGCAALEAQACGRPVLALGAGGMLETVVGVNAAQFETPPGFTPWAEMGAEGGEAAPTGMFFARAAPDEVEEAVLAFEGMEGDFSPAAARGQAERFGRERFKEAAQTHFLEGRRAHHERLEKFGAEH